MRLTAGCSLSGSRTQSLRRFGASGRGGGSRRGGVRSVSSPCSLSGRT